MFYSMFLLQPFKTLVVFQCQPSRDATRPKQLVQSLCFALLIHPVFVAAFEKKIVRTHVLLLETPAVAGHI